MRPAQIAAIGTVLIVGAMAVSAVLMEKTGGDFRSLKVGIDNQWEGPNPLDKLTVNLRTNSGLVVYPVVPGPAYRLNIVGSNLPRVAYSPEKRRLTAQILRSRHFDWSAPDHDALGLSVHTWQAVNLAMNTGSSFINLTGIPVQKLQIDSIASRVHVAFYGPNPIRMDDMGLEMKASDVRLTGIGNANSRSLVVSAVSGRVLIDFSGKPSLPMSVIMNGRMSTATLKIPKYVRCRIHMANQMAVRRGFHLFTRENPTTWVQSLAELDRPMIDIWVNLRAGSVSIIQEDRQ